MSQAAPRPAADSPWTPLRDRFVAAQLAGDRREAVRLIVEEGLGKGADVATLHMDVLQSAQCEIGVLWQQNRISIAQEHMATAVSHVALTRLFEEARPAARNGRKVVIACVEGEMHEFPARLVSDFLELAGFEMRYLGANVPLHHLLRLVDEERPHLLALSVTMSFNVAALRAAVEAVRARHPQLPILVGGHAFGWEPDLARELGVETCGPEASCVVDTARRLVSGTLR
jgi:methanogenic corrinoid protein MtbC1